MKKNRLSIRQAFQLQRRAEKIFHREMPGLLLAIWMKNLFTAGGPYVTVYFSARVIDELSGTRDPKQLMIWALLALFSGAAVAFLNAVWMHRENRFAYPHWYVLQKILTGKMLCLRATRRCAVPFLVPVIWN